MMVTRIRDLVPLDEELIAKAIRRMTIGLQLRGLRHVDTMVDRYPSTKDAEITAWGER